MILITIGLLIETIVALILGSWVTYFGSVAENLFIGVVPSILFLCMPTLCCLFGGSGLAKVAELRGTSEDHFLFRV
jgi:hypothetical protein